MLPVIGLTGKAGSGKDTAAQFLIEAGYPVERVGFADHLKFVTASLLDLDPEPFFDPVQKEAMVPRLGKTHRQLLLEVGSKLREVDSAIWVYWADVNVQDLFRRDRGVVFTDVRYTNEGLYIRGLGGHIIEVNRPSHVHHDPTVRHHPSEHYNGPIDATIENTSDMLMFRMQMLSLMELWYGPPAQSDQLHTVDDPAGPGYVAAQGV